MLKLFYLKILTVIITTIAVILSINNYNQFVQTKNFTIINEGQSIIIQLQSGQYIEIISKNDIVTTDNAEYPKPFTTYTKILKNSNLENSIANTNTATEYIESGDGVNRLITLTPANNKKIDIELITNTLFIYKDNAKYNIQLDYTKQANYKIDKNTVQFTDSGCEITIKGDNIEYSITPNNQSIILSKDYELETTFDFNINIECN